MNKPLAPSELIELVGQPVCWIPPTPNGLGKVMHKVGFMAEYRAKDHAARVSVPLPSGAFYDIVLRADTVRPDPRVGFRAEFEQVAPPATVAKPKEKTK